MNDNVSLKKASTFYLIYSFRRRTHCIQGDDQKQCGRGRSF